MSVGVMAELECHAEARKPIEAAINLYYLGPDFADRQWAGLLHLPRILME